jgi:hypothetical protein
MSKTLIVVLSDPKSGTEEALGRVFNALTTAYDLKERKAHYKILFQGTGTRWLSEIASHEHLLHGLYVTVINEIEGACGGCADVFGATEEVESIGLPLLRTLKIPGTNGVTSLGKYIEEGYQIITF